MQPVDLINGQPPFTIHSESVKPIAVMGPKRLFRLFLRALIQELRKKRNRSWRTLQQWLKVDLAMSKVPLTVRPETTFQTEPQPPAWHHKGKTDSLHFLNDRFDRIVVFTIPRNEECRMRRLRQELPDVDYEVFYGLDQLDFSELELRSILRDLGSAPPPHANVAMMAHNAGFITLLQDIVSRKSERTLFIEDDFMLTPFGASVFRGACAELEATPIRGNWDLLHFHSHLPCTPLDLSMNEVRNSLYYPVVPGELMPGQTTRDGLDWHDWMAAIQSDPSSCVPFSAGRQYIPDGKGGFLRFVFRGHYEHLSSLCLGISLEGAKKLLIGRDDWRPSDRMCGRLSERSAHKVYVVSPFPCRPAPVLSSFAY